MGRELAITIQIAAIFRVRLKTQTASRGFVPARVFQPVPVIGVILYPRRRTNAPLYRAAAPLAAPLTDRSYAKHILGHRDARVAPIRRSSDVYRSVEPRLGERVFTRAVLTLERVKFRSIYGRYAGSRGNKTFPRDKSRDLSSRGQPRRETGVCFRRQMKRLFLRGRGKLKGGK